MSHKVNIMTRQIATTALLALLLAAAASILSACHTMEGVGKDIQDGGKSLETSADTNK
jgi:predicted small secreted protein